MTTTSHRYSPMTGTMPDTLMTPRLKLRAPVLADAQRIAMFIGDWDVARMLARVPYPYCEADAVNWISSAQAAGDSRYVLVHANGVIGVVGIEKRDDGVAELGYWLAKPFWGRGLMTEAACAVIAASRAADQRAPITCSHFEDNPRSQRVIEQLGFVATGEKDIRSVSRNADVRCLTYRLPEPKLRQAAAASAPPVLTPA